MTSQTKDVYRQYDRGSYPDLLGQTAVEFQDKRHRENGMIMTNENNRTGSRDPPQIPPNYVED